MTDRDTIGSVGIKMKQRCEIELSITLARIGVKTQDDRHTTNLDVMFFSHHQRGHCNGNSVTSQVMGSHCKVLERIGTSPMSPLTLEFPTRSRGTMDIDHFCSLVVGEDGGETDPDVVPSCDLPLQWGGEGWGG